jgi:hypothetical protein
MHQLTIVIYARQAGTSLAMLNDIIGIIPPAEATMILDKLFHQVANQKKLVVYIG